MEEGADACEDEDEDDGGEGGGLPPPKDPSPLGGLEISPCNLLFLSS